MRYEDFRTLVQQDPAFDDFRAMLTHEALQRFVYHEKCILGPLSESRIFYNEETGQEGGVAHSTQMILDECYGVFTPFQLKGVWIPLADGVHYSILSDLNGSPLIRQRLGQPECLYLIHPKSEALYIDLLEQYQDSSVIVSALSLSSPRSLLVALPKESGGFEPVMVKVSLNQASHGLVRLLSERECALSVANTSIFSRVLVKDSDIPLEIFEDTFSFVPKKPCLYEHGMIYRQIPSFLHPEKATTEPLQFVMPLLALYGQQNADVLKQLVFANGHHVTAFLTTIFNVFLQSVIPLLLDHELSIEAHGQNLLLVFTHDFQFKGLMYRDMGGVNVPIEANDFGLPDNLRRPELSYFDNHLKDAANAMEHHFIWRGLYPLTKQLVKQADYFRENDPQFNQWYEACLQMQPWNGVLGNWTDGDPDSDLHQERLAVTSFNRYGYVECLFGELLIQCLDSRMPSDLMDDFRRHLFSPEQITNDLIVAPCTYKTFFDEAIRAILSALSIESSLRFGRSGL